MPSTGKLLPLVSSPSSTSMLAPLLSSASTEFSSAAIFLTALSSSYHAVQHRSLEGDSALSIDALEGVCLLHRTLSALSLLLLEGRR
jgi:hypothetical protein